MDRIKSIHIYNLSDRFNMIVEYHHKSGKIISFPGIKSSSISLSSLIRLSDLTYDLNNQGYMTTLTPGLSLVIRKGIL
jgi:hypothetical protein